MEHTFDCVRHGGFLHKFLVLVKGTRAIQNIQIQFCYNNTAEEFLLSDM